MANFMHSLKRWHRILISLILLWLMFISGTENLTDLGIVATVIYGVLFIVFNVLCLKYENKEKYEARKMASANAAAKIEKAEKYAEWSENNGTYSCKVVGVTFKNDDGSSRQGYLKEAYINNSRGTVNLQPYKYEDHQAIRVMYEGLCIGNVPQNEVDTIMDYLPRLSSTFINVDTFRDDDNNLVYRADLLLTYKK